MDEVQEAAQNDLDAAVELCAGRGLVQVWRSLVQDVYSTNLDRYEPDELGDTAMTLGIQCAENLKMRALRRSKHDDREPAEHHWNVAELSVTTPANTLTFELASARVVVMKVPYDQGRTPLWDRFSVWEQESHVRLQVAETNSLVLGGYRAKSPAELPLFPHSAPLGTVKDYMLVWGGEPLDSRTAGWLTVPVLGEVPFVARTRLWWDEEPSARSSITNRPSRGPSFDERRAAGPQISLKPRPAAREES